MGDDEGATLSLGCCLAGVFLEALAGVDVCEPRPERALLLEDGVDMVVLF